MKQVARHIEKDSSGWGFFLFLNFVYYFILEINQTVLLFLNYIIKHEIIFYFYIFCYFSDMWS